MGTLQQSPTKWDVAEAFAFGKTAAISSKTGTLQKTLAR
jgi:hypothetical protein